MEKDEFIEMGEGKDGVYHPVAVVKQSTNPPVAHIPRRMGAFMEMVDGFVIGLEAIENFMRNVKKMGKGGK